MSRAPEPEFIWIKTDYGIAYAWRVTGRGIAREGSTRLDAIVNWLNAVESKDEP